MRCCGVLVGCLLAGVSSVLKIGVFDPKNKDKDGIDVMIEEFQYITDKLGFTSKEPPSE